MHAVLSEYVPLREARIRALPLYVELNVLELTNWSVVRMGHLYRSNERFIERWVPLVHGLQNVGDQIKQREGFHKAIGHKKKYTNVFTIYVAYLLAYIGKHLINLQKTMDCGGLLICEVSHHVEVRCKRVCSANCVIFR